MFPPSWQQKDCVLASENVWQESNKLRQIFFFAFFIPSDHQRLSPSSKKMSTATYVRLKMSQHGSLLRSRHVKLMAATNNKWKAGDFFFSTSSLGGLRPSVTQANGEEINIYKKQLVWCTFALETGVHMWGGYQAFLRLPSSPSSHLHILMATQNICLSCCEETSLVCFSLLLFFEIYFPWGFWIKH